MSVVNDKILLTDGTLHIKLGDETVDEQFNEQTNLTNILKWYERNVYRHLYLPLCPNETDNTIKCSHADALQSAMELIYNMDKVKINVYLSTSANLFPLKNFIFTEQSLTLTYHAWNHTLRDLATYSPYALDGSHLRLLFIIYQLLKVMSFFHQCGLSTGPLQLTDIHINDRYWIQLKPRFHSCLASLDLISDSEIGHHDDFSAQNNHDEDRRHRSSSEKREQTESFSSRLADKSLSKHIHKESTVLTTIQSPLSTSTVLSSSPVYHVQHRYETYCRTQIDIVELIKQWQLGHVSNFDYLLILNALSGKRFDDPNNHLIFPWIHDFSDPHKNLRDLSQSKYRLNKGDAQLDLTYNYYSTTMTSVTNIVPHHLSEHLSSITYYVYKARRTDKRTLCEHVRSNWVPHEYPPSVARLYSWTPEECIPEFFYDSTLFQSIHDDLPDLRVPDWCSSPDEFVQRHRQLLESREVSERLHLWIDLVFGNKLTGEGAIEAKNVFLPLVDHHEDLRNTGTVQLFTKSHPPRFICMSRRMIETKTSSENSRRSTIGETDQTKKMRSLSTLLSYQPVESPLLINALSETFSHLDALEQLLMLTSSTFGRLPSATFTNRSSKFNSPFQNACQQDLRYFALCALELILLGKQHYVSSNSNGHQRLTTAKELLNLNWQSIPVPLRTCLNLLLLNLNENGESLIQQQITDRAINVAFFLNRWTTPIPFPFYFEELYRFLHQIEQYDQQLLNASTFHKKKITERKYQLLISQIPTLLLTMSTQNGHELLMPYIFDAFRDPNFGVRCIYTMFNSVALVLGPDESRKQLLPWIQSVLNPEKPTTFHWRCFTRRFIIQLIARFNLLKFLNSFPIFIIEACSGFKDEIYLKTETEESTDDLNQTMTDMNFESLDTSPQSEWRNNLFEINEEQQLTEPISDAAAETIIYLQVKLGPVLGCKYFGRHLLRMLALCYVEDEQLQLLPPDKNPFKTIRAVCGDLNAKKIIDCLLSLVQTYGEQIILLFYFPHLIEMVRLANHRMTVRNESALLSCIVLMKSILPYLSDNTLMAQLSDPIKTRIVHPYLSLLSSNSIHFPSFERCRSICAYRILDIFFLLSLRMGYESTRLYMNDSIRTFFSCFQSSNEPNEDNNRVRAMAARGFSNRRPSSPTSSGEFHGTGTSLDSDEYCRITIDSLTNSYKIGSPVRPNQTVGKQARSVSHSLLNTQINEDDNPSTNIHTRESIEQEVQGTFTTELACTAFIQLCRLCGDQHMNSLLSRTMPIYAYITDLTSKPEVSSSISTSAVLTSIRDRDIRYQNNDESRFLRKNWLSYWEHEVGRSETTGFSFKQIHLQSFIGHTNAVRSLCILDDESTFLSGGRDQKLLIWKVENQNDNGMKVESRWSYNNYRKSVFSIAFLESLRLAATCDGSIHVLDPFRGQLVVRYNQPKEGLPFAAMTSIPVPNTNILAATSDGIVRFFDVRTKASAHEWKVSLATSGQVKTLAVSPNASSAVIGFNTGAISVFDIRTGYVMGSLKVPEGEILRANYYSRHRFFTSSGEGSIFLWNTNELSSASPPLLKSHIDPAPFVLTTRSGEFIVATQTNKLCIYSRVKGGAQMDFQCTRLQSDNVKGTLSAVGLLPENRLLLFGSENGNIELLC